MPFPTSFFITSCIILVLVCCSTPAAAFGAGNIVTVSQVAGKNWRHGDIEDTLLELFMSLSGEAKFDRLAVKRVYFGNWLRDYSQAIDVGGLKQLPKDTIRVMLWVLSFVTFGFATGEFEVTEGRLGCYRPEEHIDNPKDYADNEDARKYDSRLRGPVNEAKELAVDENNGMKVYIASEHAGIETSAAFVRKCFSKSIQHARKYGKNGNEPDLYEALRMLGTGLHCLEDFSAHSNYVELALRELKVDAFAHVGENCRVKVHGKTVWPVVTGTFGMTDFLHSVVGEVSDKMVQSEVQTLENQMDEACNNRDQTSTLKGILDNIPFGLLGLGDSDFGSEADKIQEQAQAKELEQKASIDPNNKKKGLLDPEDMKRQASQTANDIYPILEFHDKVIKAMMKGIDKIPGASELLENLTGALQIFIFSMLAPYIKPILERVKVELAAGSSGILEASEKGQYIVWNDDNSSNPTHSMLSKDHFTNVLNEVAGRVASETVRFVVPLVVSCWEDENKNAQQTIDEILQVLHHPALRKPNHEGQQKMFAVVKNWWEEKDETTQQNLRQALSKAGVKEGLNHEGDDPVGGPGGKGHNHGSCGHSHGYSSGQGQQRQVDSGPRSAYGTTQSHGRTVIEKPQGGMGRFLAGSGGGHQSERGTESYSTSRQQEEKPQGSAAGLLGGILSSVTGGKGAGGIASAVLGSNNNNDRNRIGETSSYGGNTGEAYSSPGRNQESSYGATTHGRRQEASAYGGQESSYGPNTSSTSYGGGSEDTRTSSYGRSGGYDNKSSSGYGRDNTEDTTSSYRHDRDETEQNTSYRSTHASSHRGGNTSYYGETQENESSYGTRSTRQDIERETYGGQTTGRRVDDSRFSVGEETSAYGSRNSRRGNADDEEITGGGYGRSRNIDNDTYGSGNTYSSGNRRYGDGDDTEETTDEPRNSKVVGGAGYRPSEKTSAYDNSAPSYGRDDESTSGNRRRGVDREDSSYGVGNIPGGYAGGDDKTSSYERNRREDTADWEYGSGRERVGGRGEYGNQERENYSGPGRQQGYGREY